MITSLLPDSTGIVRTSYGATCCWCAEPTRDPSILFPLGSQNHVVHPWCAFRLAAHFRGLAAVLHQEALQIATSPADMLDSWRMPEPSDPPVRRSRRRAPRRDPGRD